MKRLYLVEITTRMFVSSSDPEVVIPCARENACDALSEFAAATYTVTPVASAGLTREDAVNVPWNAQYGDGDARTCGEVAGGVGTSGRARRVG